MITIYFTFITPYGAILSLFLRHFTGRLRTLLTFLTHPLTHWLFIILLEPLLSPDLSPDLLSR